MEKAREKSKTNNRLDKDKLDRVRTSATRFGSDINNPNHPDYEFSSNDSGHVIKSKKHPIEVSYTKDGDGSYIQNTRTTGSSKDRVGAAREMQRMKGIVAGGAKPGTRILSQPVGHKRAALNSRLGMGDTNEQGVQGGVVAHRSPKQLAKKMPPMNPHKHEGTFIDPNH